MIVERSTRFLGINFRRQEIVGTDEAIYEEEFFRFNRHTRQVLGILGISTPRYMITITDRETFVTKDRYNPRTGESKDVKRRDISHDRHTGEARSFEFFHQGIIAPKPRFKSVDSTPITL